MILVFDTETSSLVDKNLSVNHPQQARLVELGAILCDNDGTERSTLSLIVRLRFVPSDLTVLPKLTPTPVRVVSEPKVTAPV